MASGETHGAESLSEQFGVRWSESMERYVRTWLDFVFLRPRRFAKRYELRRDRYTRPVVFFVDSLLLAGFGLWAVESLSSTSSDAVGTVKPTIISDGVNMFGVGIFLLVLCVIAVFMTFRRPRIRPLFNALAYSSGLLVLLPFVFAIADGVADLISPFGDIAAIYFLFAILVIDGFYLAFAVVAFHHLRAKFFIPALAALVIAYFVLVSLAPRDWQYGVEKELIEAYEEPEIRFDNMTARQSVILVNTHSAAPFAERWEGWESISTADTEINVRILYWAPTRTINDLTVALHPLGIAGGFDTIFMVVLRGTHAEAASRFALVNHIVPSQLTLERLRIYPEGKKTSAAAPDSESIAQITRDDGLSLGTLPKGRWGFIVATFKIRR